MLFWYSLKPLGLLRAENFPRQPLAQISWIKYSQYLFLSNTSYKCCSGSIFMSSAGTDLETNKSYPQDQDVMETTFWWIFSPASIPQQWYLQKMHSDAFIKIR